MSIKKSLRNDQKCLYCWESVSIVAEYPLHKELYIGLHLFNEVSVNLFWKRPARIASSKQRQNVWDSFFNWTVQFRDGSFVAETPSGMCTNLKWVKWYTKCCRNFWTRKKKYCIWVDIEAFFLKKKKTKIKSYVLLVNRLERKWERGMKTNDEQFLKLYV